MGAADSFNEIATLRIELVGSEPLIWREVEVPTSVTLKVLHHIVQAAMGWFDDHLWELTVAGRRYGPSAAGKARLRDVLRPSKTRIDYLYDFGDSWEHRLTLTRIRAGDPGLSYPRYVAGERNAPPEDCGGLPGFYELLDAVRDPAHPEHDHATEWLDDYDPDTIDEEPINAALLRIARRRNAAKVRKSKSEGSPPAPTS